MISLADAPHLGILYPNATICTKKPKQFTKGIARHAAYKKISGDWGRVLYFIQDPLDGWWGSIGGVHLVVL